MEILTINATLKQSGLFFTEKRYTVIEKNSFYEASISPVRRFEKKRMLTPKRATADLSVLPMIYYKNICLPADREQAKQQIIRQIETDLTQAQATQTTLQKSLIKYLIRENEIQSNRTADSQKNGTL